MSTRTVVASVICLAVVAALAACSDESSDDPTLGDTSSTTSTTGDDADIEPGDGDDDTGTTTDDPDGAELDVDPDVTGDVATGDATAITDGGGDAGDTTVTDTGDPTDMSREDYCMGDGPPIIVSDNGGQGLTTVCTGDIAQVSFRYAICTCEGITTSSELVTDAFDSSVGPYMAPGDIGGAVGANGQLLPSNRLDIGGSLWLGSTEGLVMSSEIEVAQEFRDNGPLTSSGAPIAVGADAYVNGDISVNGTATIGGSLYLPQSATVTGTVNSAGEVRGPVVVPPPCDCSEDQLVDIASFVDYYATNNDNADIGLDPDALSDTVQPVTLELDCGRFYLSEITNSNTVVIRANARTALFIGGDVVTSNALSVELAEGAELDIFVAGTFTSSNRVDLGSVDNPANVRLYIGTDQDIAWNNTFTIGGNVYAPRARLSIASELEVFGSIFVRALDAANKLTVHYDRAVLDAGADCDDPPPTTGDMDAVDTDGGNPPGMMCDSCRDCGNQACVDGECGSCTDSSQCCSPLICIQGTCVIAN